MIGKTNSGFGKCVALIHVYYKSGTTVTCTKGTRSYGSDTSGEYVFQLSETGEWTVSGKNSADETITFTLTMAKGESKTVLFDTLIPPAYRDTYEEVEYIKLKDCASPYSQVGSVPLGIRTSLYTGVWDMEIEKVLPQGVDGNRVVGGAKDACYVQNINSALALVYYNSAKAAGSMPANIAYNVKMHFEGINAQNPTADKASLKINDETRVTEATAAYTGASEFHLGRLDAASGSSGVGAALPAQYTIVKLTCDGTLVGHFIPCKRKADGMPGYFNKVDNTFHQGYNSTNTTLESVLQVVEAGPAVIS